MSTSPSILPVIVGAGPAGIRAAQALVAAGIRPVILDEATRPGGQIYRQPPLGFKREKKALYGSEHHKACDLHRTMESLRERVDYRSGTLVWSGDKGSLDTLSDGHFDTVPYTHLILATGATDRTLPFPGWLTPGVYTLGGAQVALKFQGCGIGQKVVFLGTGPLLYLVAYQYKKAGANVAAVLDTARLSDRIAGLPGMLRAPALLSKGLYYMAWLRAHGVPLHSNVRPEAVTGSTRVASLRYRHAASDTVYTIECDAIGFGLGLRSETQLASLLGCEFAFNAQDRAWLARRDTAGRTSNDGIYVAGDGAGIAGADAAELSGERAALAMLQDTGIAVDQARVDALERRLESVTKVRRALERAFPFPTDWVAQVADDVVVCRCEEITAGTIRRAATELEVREMNRLKALTRVGMGRCQGRMCSAGAAEILAQSVHIDLAAVGRIRTQPPVKPIPIVIQSVAGQEVSL